MLYTFRTILLFSLTINLILGCAAQPKSFIKSENSVIITLDTGVDVKKIRLSIIDEKIIRVTASPVSGFSEKESLMTIKQSDEIKNWEVEEQNDLIIISTSKLTIKVFKETGAITFLDKAGKVLLAEPETGGKFMETTEAGQGLFKLRQVFDSPEGEAFYGLGQHQHGYMNYKGKDVDLTQQNIVAVVPFLLSNKNYGILWDNYSITKFGDPRNYGQISDLILQDKEGNSGGLTATYYVGNEIIQQTIEDRINYQYLETDDYGKLPSEATKVTWEGRISSEVAGKHKFLLYASSYFKLWVDGELLFDKWRQNWNPWSNPFEIDLKPGEHHDLKIEWIPEGGYLSLTHLNPLPEQEQNQLSLTSESGYEIDYYFIHGETADEIISGYRQVTGKSPILPKWAYGFWQSRERYKTQNELLDVVRTFRDKEIPIDNIVLDWFYWPEDQWGSHELETSRFPDPEGMIRELHEDLNTNIMISVWPKYYPGTEHYREMDAKGYLFKHNIEQERIDWVGKGYTNTFYDPFNPGARDMFWDQLNEHLFSNGFDAWWLDATAPDMHSNLRIA
ncbi:MAG: DUF4968 domain-containing protein, partial [Bacteroidetes bacterium]